MSYEEKGGPADIGEASDNNSSKLNNTLKNVTTQEIIPILHNKTGKDVEPWFEFDQGYPSFERYEFLRGIADQLFGGAWLLFDDNLISIWFGPNWEKAVSTASEISKQNRWAFRHDKKQRYFYFGRAYARQIVGESAESGWHPTKIAERRPRAETERSPSIARLD